MYGPPRGRVRSVGVVGTHSGWTQVQADFQVPETLPANSTSALHAGRSTGESQIFLYTDVRSILMLFIVIQRHAELDCERVRRARQHWEGVVA